MKRKQRRRRSAEAAFTTFHRQLVRLAGRALADEWTARLKRLGRVPRFRGVVSRNSFDQRPTHCATSSITGENHVSVP